MADVRKEAYIKDLIRRMQALDILFDDSPDIEKEYFDLTYNGGGAREITDADVLQYGIVAADITNAITLIGAIKTMAVTYAGTTNVLKRVAV